MTWQVYLVTCEMKKRILGKIPSTAFFFKTAVTAFFKMQIDITAFFIVKLQCTFKTAVQFQNCSALLKNAVHFQKCSKNAVMSKHIKFGACLPFYHHTVLYCTQSNTGEAILLNCNWQNLHTMRHPMTWATL